MKLDYDADDSGTQILSGHTFENVQFDDLEIWPSFGRQIRVVNCNFLNCTTLPGTCVIGNGVTLDRVVFSNLDCGDAIRINSMAVLKEVVVKGNKPKELIVQPEYGAKLEIAGSEDVDFQLDISDFVGDVIIVGIRGDKVRKDPSRHVSIHAKWKEEIDWKSLGIGPFSYWRIYIQKLMAFNAQEGVFALPGIKHKHYAETMRERERLERTGVTFA